MTGGDHLFVLSPSSSLKITHGPLSRSSCCSRQRQQAAEENNESATNLPFVSRKRMTGGDTRTLSSFLEAHSDPLVVLSVARDKGNKQQRKTMNLLQISHSSGNYDQDD
ncbi:hypothetical protein CEXT_331661 [Caerostris extrusa]|uniref:Uncharacterized protein n=1 Tax=Caerostris extrusa TaxID=172846 RepID=A0AAV4PD28_CAEEX|nr:hypothetical protein CEXT_331661 [Caerostris extrusa]